MVVLSRPAALLVLVLVIERPAIIRARLPKRLSSPSPPTNYTEKPTTGAAYWLAPTPILRLPSLQSLTPPNPPPRIHRSNNQVQHIR